MTTKTTLKGYFENGDVPNGAQFSELIDFMSPSGVETTVQANSAVWGGGTVISTTTTTTSVASSITDVSLSVSSNVIHIAYGRWYVNDTVVAPFSDTGTLTIYTSSSRHGSNAIYRGDMDLVADTMASPAAGSTVSSTDGTVFAADDLVFISGSSGSEFSRISSVATNDLIMEDAIVNAYGTGSLISLVPEFGELTYYDSDESQTIWARVTLTSSNTVNTLMWMEYS